MDNTLFDSIKSQELTWNDLGYTSFMSRPSTGPQFMSGDEIDALLEEISGKKIVNETLSGSALVNETITNKKIAPSNRAVTAVVSQSADADYGDIQTALDFCKSLGGGEVLVLPGTYYPSSSLTIYSDTRLRGISVADCIIDFQSSTRQLALNNLATDVTIESLTFQNGWNTTTGTIYVRSGIRTLIEHCVFDGNKNGSDLGYDIYANGTLRLKIRDCATDDGSTFLYNASTAGIGDISHNKIQDCAGFAFVLNGGSSRYNNNEITSVMGAFSGNPGYSVISENYVTLSSSFTGATIDLQDADNTRIIGNRFDSSNSHSAIEISSTDDIIIMGNHIASAKENTPMILIETSVRALIAANDIKPIGTPSGSDGIRISDSDRCSITGNIIRDGGAGTSYAVNVADSGCNDTLIVGNILLGTTGDINDAGTSTTTGSND